MKLQRTVYLFLTALLAFAMPLAAQAQQGAKQKVIFQVSDADPAKWNIALNNAKNVQTELGKDNVQIEIVAYGPGLGMLEADSKVEGSASAKAGPTYDRKRACCPSVRSASPHRGTRNRPGRHIFRGHPKDTVWVS